MAVKVNERRKRLRPRALEKGFHLARRAIAAIRERREAEKAKKAERLLDIRFAERALKAIAITTVIFMIAQYVSFLVTGLEQAVLIERYFTAVVAEIGALMLKRIMEVVVARAKQKEGLDAPDIEQEEQDIESEEYTDAD